MAGQWKDYPGSDHDFVLLRYTESGELDNSFFTGTSITFLPSLVVIVLYSIVLLRVKGRFVKKEDEELLRELMNIT